MHRGLRFALVVFGAVAFAASVRADSEKDADYRSFLIPSHRWFTWYVDVGASGQRNSLNVPGQASRDGNLGGNVSTSAAWFRDSDRLQHNIAVSFGVFGSRFHYEATASDSFGYRTVERSDRNLQERLSLEGSVRTYPWRAPLGLQIAGRIETGLTRFRRDGENVFRNGGRRLETLTREESDESALAVTATATAGVGRVRDATVVYHVQLLEQRLIEARTLNGALSPATRRKLEDLFYVGSRRTQGRFSNPLDNRGFGVPHDRPEKFLWREIERILREDGALETGSLDAYAVFRVLEPTMRVRPVRSVGFFIGPSATVFDSQRSLRRHQRAEFLAVQDTFVNRRTDTDEGHSWFHQASSSVGAQAEYHRPLSMALQFDALSSARIADDLQVTSLNSIASGTYLIADRWYANVKLDHSWNPSPSARDPWRMAYGATLSYYLEDAWLLEASVSALETHDRERTSHNAELAIGVRHYLSRWLQVPGIVDPVRMLQY